MNPTPQQILDSKIGKLNPHLKELAPGRFRPAPAPLNDPLTIPEGLKQIGPEGDCNKLEASYLSWLRTLGDTKIWVHSIGLRLSNRVFYYPDFGALAPDRTLRFIDTKGVWKGQTKPHIEDDALVKMKWAAQLYYPWRFIIAWRIGGVWQHKEII